MGGKWYQAEAFEIVDYDLFRIDGSNEWFRGPSFDLSGGSYVTFIGAAQVFGTFCRYPFSHLLAERLPRPVLNLGIGGAGPKRFVEDEVLMRKINGGSITVIQIMSGRSAENSEYEVLDGCSSIRPRGSNENWEFAETVWQRLLKNRPEKELRRLIQENQSDWLSNMKLLLQNIKTPKILLWISHRSPSSYPSDLAKEFAVTMEVFPHFITQDLIDEIIPFADEYVEVVSNRRSPQLLSDRRTGLPYTVNRKEGGFSYQMGYPSPEMHVDITEALFPVLWNFLPKPWTKS